MHGQVETTGVMSSFFMLSIIRENDVYILANIDAICFGKATIARVPSNDTEHDPYAVAVLEDMGRGAAGGSGCATCLCTAKPMASISFSSSCQYCWGGVAEAIPTLGQAHKEDTRS